MNAPLLQQAISLYQSGQADKAAAICRNVLQKQPGQPDALHILGNIAKDQGQLQQALQYLQQGLRSMYAPESLQTLHDFFAEWAPPERSDTKEDDTQDNDARDDLESPVFLVGFPRSGTTLLDQILSSHSQIAVLEEKENLEDFYMRFPATPERLPELVSCPAGELQTWRDTYWRRIEDENGLSNDRVVVDKLPLNTILLPYIQRLFPAAKIVFALRDPRDAVFSCFQQRFGMNQAMFQFLKLETAVRYYDQVMSLARLYKDRLSIPMHVIRYEAVITDFDVQAQDVLEYLGLPWEDGVRDYQATAKQRRISTPSARDVTRPLYTSSIGKWRQYREQIGGQFEPLQKWVEYWGYEAD